MDDEPRAVEDRPLETGLEEEAQPALGADERPGVRDGVLAISGAGRADDLVRGGEAGPQRDLQQEVSPAARRES